MTAALESWDAESLDRALPHVERLVVTLETHLPQILARLRPEEDPSAALERLGRAVEAARARDVPLEVEVPLAAENASMLPETVAWLGGEGVAHVRVVPYRARAAGDRAIDVFRCFSERYLERIEVLSRQAAADAGVSLVWEPRAGRSFGLVELPGVCEDAWQRVRIAADGEVEPCMYAERGELTLGRIGPGSSLADVWEGASARDLRRAHLTWDHPAACITCPRTLGPDSADAGGFVARFVDEAVGEAGVEVALDVLGPGPVARLDGPPDVRLRRPDRAVRRWHLVLAAGGEPEHLRTFEVGGVLASERVVRIDFPAAAWEELEPNAAQWWAVFGQAHDGSWLGMATPRCLVRHRDLPRLAGSTLRYPRAGETVPAQPTPRATGFLKAEYRALVERVREAVSGVVPEGAVCLVATKGDDGLLDLGAAVGWHFPRGQQGGYAGFNPPDGRWAVEHLEQLRAAGAEYLVLPATAFWWREHYPELAAWLQAHGRPVLEERDTCVILALDGQAIEEAA